MQINLKQSNLATELKDFEKAELCVIRCLKQYLLITNPLRCVKTTQLLTSYIRPHNSVPVDTVSRWLKELPRLSGIDTSIITGYSTRPASASKGKQVGWNNKTTVETFYNKPIANNSMDILQGK